MGANSEISVPVCVGLLVGFAALAPPRQQMTGQGELAGVNQQVVAFSNSPVSKSVSSVGGVKGVVGI
jgi:hypothetical protein